MTKEEKSRYSEPEASGWGSVLPVLTPIHCLYCRCTQKAFPKILKNTGITMKIPVNSRKTHIVLVDPSRVYPKTFQ
jgi:hypothetical protein